MNVLIVYWHPEPKSFNGAMVAQGVKALESAGHSVQISDLYNMKFDPVSGRNNFKTVNNDTYFKQQLEELHATDNNGFVDDIEAEIEKLNWSDLVIFQFPLWWFGMPAAMKGWVDRVFAMGRVYGGGRFYDKGIFKGKKAMLSVTMGGGEDLYVKGGWNGDLNGILRPIHRGMLEFTGFSVLAPFTVFGPAKMNEVERASELARYTARLDSIFYEERIDVGEY